jgi:hypothetical protein
MGCGIGVIRSQLLDLGSIDGQLQTPTRTEAEDIVNDMQYIFIIWIQWLSIMANLGFFLPFRWFRFNLRHLFILHHKYSQNRK